MPLRIDRQRLLLFAAIGALYCSLWVWRDYVQTPATFWPRVVNNLWLCAYLTAVNFVFYEYAARAFRFTWRRLLLAPFVLFGFLMLYSFGIYGWRMLGIGLGIYNSLITHASVLAGVTYHTPYGMMSIFFFGLLRLVHDFVKLKQAAQQLRIEKQQAELNYLKSQTNPHFLFNTLNNIYALAREKSDLAPESILRLSKILRFMLYETGGDYIALEQELKILGDYIELEKLRYDASLRVELTTDIDDPKQPVPPLLLVPLVENAFKHGVSETRNRPFVEVALRVQGGRLDFTVRNSAETTPAPGPRCSVTREPR